MFRVHPAIVLLGTLSTGVCAEDSLRLPDPTQPPVIHQSAVRRQAIAQPQEFNVSAIKIAGQQRRALVNGQLVAEGDQIGEAQVIEIAPRGVVVEYLSERRELSLLPRRIRRPIAGSQ